MVRGSVSLCKRRFHGMMRAMKLKSSVRMSRKSSSSELQHTVRPRFKATLQICDTQAAIFWPLKVATAALTFFLMSCSKCSHSLASIVATGKSRQVDSVKLPPIRCDPLNMRHQDFNIIFQPPKETTSGFVLIKKCRFKSRSYGAYNYFLLTQGTFASTQISVTFL